MNLLIKKINLIDNRSKDEDIRLELYSTLIPYILSIDIFKNNIDTRPFIEELKLNKHIKDYAYKSRTQIVARLVREIQKFDREALLYNVKVLKNHAQDSVIDYNEKNTDKIINVLNKYSRNREN